MARRLDDLLNEADALIEKKAAKAQAPASSSAEEDEVEKLANALLAEENLETMSAQKRAPTKGTDEWELGEKIAHAISIVSVLSQIEEIQKLGQFEKTAAEKGFSQDEIDHFMGEKVAAAIQAGADKVRKLLPAALAAGGAGAAGYASGRTKGKEKGYSQALNDVNQAFEQYSM